VYWAPSASNKDNAERHLEQFGLIQISMTSAFGPQGRWSGETFVRSAKCQRSYRSIGVLVIHRLTAPRIDLQHGPQLGEEPKRLGGKRVDLLLNLLVGVA
jgi:hypothetical protein